MKSGITVTFDDLKYKINKDGNEYGFDYDVPYEDVIEGIEYYFDKVHMIKVDGKNNDIWNMCVQLDILDTITESDTFIERIKEMCHEDAKEAYLEYIEELKEE